jgi:hypothetical protein
MFFVLAVILCSACARAIDLTLSRNYMFERASALFQHGKGHKSYLHVGIPACRY